MGALFKIKALISNQNLKCFISNNFTRDVRFFSNRAKPTNAFQRVENIQISNRKFSTSSSRNAIPPLVWLIFKPLTKLGAMIAGRGFRKWYRSLPDMKKELLIAHLKRNRLKYYLIVGSTSLSGFFYYESHMQDTPITQRRRFMLFSNEHLAEIEKLEKAQIFTLYEKKILDLYSPYANRALRVANRIFEANKDLKEVNNVKWKLTTGDLAVFTGLLDFVENDDELAIIMAHEMSHAILQHAAEEISRSRLIDILSISLALFVWAFLPTDLTAFITQILADKFLKFSFELPHSRNLEKEADTVGLMLTAKACFDVRHSPSFWRRMSQFNEEIVPEILSTHPANETRAKELEELLPTV